MEKYSDIPVEQIDKEALFGLRKKNPYKIEVEFDVETMKKLLEREKPMKVRWIDQGRTDAELKRLFKRFVLKDEDMKRQYYQLAPPKYTVKD